MLHTTTLLIDHDNAHQTEEAAKITAKALIGYGYQVLAGPHSPTQSYALSFSREPFTCHNASAKILLTLRPFLSPSIRRSLENTAIILSEDSLSDKALLAPEVQTATIPFSQLARQHSRKPMYSLTMAGSLLAASGLPLENLRRHCQEPTLETSYQATAKHLSIHKLSQAGSNKNNQLLVSGLESAMLGLLVSGSTFIATDDSSSYSSLNEIDTDAVIQGSTGPARATARAFGAAIAGCRSAAIVRQSADIVSALCYAVEAEIPVVVVIKATQNRSVLDTSLANSLGQQGGIIMRPANASQCWAMAQEAANLAEQWQTPVIVIIDEAVGQTYAQLGRKEKLPINRGQLLGYKQAITQTGYVSYKQTPNGLSPRKLPGQPGPTISTYANQSPLAQHKRQQKMLTASRVQLPCIIHGPKHAEVTLICTGAAVDEAIGAISILKAQAVSANVLQITTLWPLAGQQIDSIVRNSQNVLVIEAGTEAELSLTLTQQAKMKLNYVCLQPEKPWLTADYIAEIVAGKFTLKGRI